jgi:type II secretory pathway component PulJ
MVRVQKSSAGYSLLELLVVFVISGLALLLASQLLLESGSRMSHRLQETMRPVGDMALRQVASDLRMASGVKQGLSGGWSRDALVLLGHPAGDLSYVKLDNELYRLQRIPKAGSPGGNATLQERLVLQAVTTFRWRLRGPRLVEVDLGYRESPRLRQLTAGGRWRDPVLVTRQRTIRVALRGGGQRSW